MSSTPLTQGPVRPAAVVNADIRALMLAAGGRLRAEDRAVYQGLVDEWNVATAQERALGDVVTAAHADTRAPRLPAPGGAQLCECG
ncbi:hypothetical protein [Streptomyces carpinensis]|uniref:Uncharacterized protein n=1 Tax=Streptomyces carpinensis TaxID=66369 RepID=A0ABV1WHE4_9ACTN|nr:hypothetical protein [Streptomyces carpinensis]